MNSAPYVFDVDHVAKIRFGLSITVLEKKLHKITTKKLPKLSVLGSKTADKNKFLPGTI